MNTVEKRNPNVKIVRNSITTPDGTELISRYTHDYKTHVDANGLEYMVDGGLSYLRRNLHLNHPYTETSLDSDDPHEILREGVTWGCLRSGELEYINIANMSRSHIMNILKDGYTGPIIDLMLKELEWRDG